MSHAVTRSTLLLLAGALALTGCTHDDPATTPDAGSPEVDAGGGTADAGRDPSLPSCTYPQDGNPMNPFGSSVTRPFEPFSLPTCDGTDYHFYNQEFCDNRLTVISIAAGWCNPCMYESMNMAERIVRPYGPMGVRVLQVLVQDADYNAASQAFCEDWVSRFGLINTELRDEFGVTQRYFPGGSLPSTIIVDCHGIIRFRENGATMGLDSLRAKLDELLAEPDDCPTE